MHKVKWQPDVTYGDAAQLYINYLKKYYGGPGAIRVVFDGYCSLLKSFTLLCGYFTTALTLIGVKQSNH